jgi:hypothetical protein
LSGRAGKLGRKNKPISLSRHSRRKGPQHMSQFL